MSRVRDIANILSGGSSAIATDAEIPSYVAGKNLLINGNFDLWQRGTSFSGGGLYTADRWRTDQNIVVSQSSDVPNSLSTYSYDVSNTGSSTYGTFTQRIEAANIAPAVGKSLTVSFWAKNIQGGGSGPFLILRYPGSKDNWSSPTNWSSPQVSATYSNSWTYYTYTFPAIPSNFANGMEFVIFREPPASGTYQTRYAQIQLEIGSVVSSFSRAGGSIQGELAACQRYYVRFGGDANYQKIGTGPARSGQIADIAVNLPVPMRVAPHTIDYSNLLVYQFDGATGFPVTSIGATVVNNNRYIGTFYVTQAGSNWTQGTIFILVPNNSTSGYVAFSAEL